MALDRCGVLFKVRNPGKLVMTGKLQVSKKQLQRWALYPEQSYKDSTYVEVEIGLFANDKGGQSYYPIMEFIKDDKDGAEQGEGEKDGDDIGLPF